MKKRFSDGGTISVGAYKPQPSQLSGGVDRSQTTNEVLDSMQQANTPMLMAKKGGYIKAADGIAKRGRTKGKMR
jgi:hypothetical protein